MTCGFFIMGFPEETHETLYETEKQCADIESQLARMTETHGIYHSGYEFTDWAVAKVKYHFDTLMKGAVVYYTSGADMVDVTRVSK